MKHFLMIVSLVVGVFAFAMCTEKVVQKTEDMSSRKSNKELTRIKIVIGSETLGATLYDNPTARSLLEQIPFTVELEDYAATEKIFYPAKSLNIEEAPKGADPSAGDIMYYAPWGDVAVFYKDFRYAEDLIPIEHVEDITGFVDALVKNKSLVTFKKIE